MKIAIPNNGDHISMHYGKCEEFVIYDIDSNKNIINKRKIKNGGIRGCESASLLSELDVEIVIAGGIGENAKRNLEAKYICVLVGAKGNCDTIIQSFLDETLELDETLLHSH